MNLKKWGSLLTAIAMVGSMAATSLPVSAAEATPDKIFSGTFTGTHISYEYNATAKTITLTSDKNGEVIPALSYVDTTNSTTIADTINDQGIINAIKYDLKNDYTDEQIKLNVEGTITAITKLDDLEKIIINDGNIDGVENVYDTTNNVYKAAFWKVPAGAKIEIHCQSDILTTSKFVIDETSASTTLYQYKKQEQKPESYSKTDVTLTAADVTATGTNVSAWTKNYTDWAMATDETDTLEEDTDLENEYFGDTLSDKVTNGTDATVKWVKGDSDNASPNASFTYQKWTREIESYTTAEKVTLTAANYEKLTDKDGWTVETYATEWTDVVGANVTEDKAYDDCYTGDTLNDTIEIDTHTRWKYVDEVSSPAGKVKVELKNITGGAQPITTIHEMEANTALKNHKCKYGDAVDNTYAGHDFTAAGGAKIDTTAHTHTCACGKTDVDYVKDTNTYTLGGVSKTYYADIHTFDAKTHNCSVCGAHNAQLHDNAANLQFTTDKNGHSKKCKTGTCTYVTTKESHKMTYTGDVSKSINIGGTVISIPEHTHYCEVCGYHESDVQNHEYLYVMKPQLQAGGGYALKPTVPGAGTSGLVCICGKVKEDHKDHTFKGENTFHYCLCGELQKSDGGEIHVYNHRFDVTTGQLIYDAGASGVICDCGAIKYGHTHVASGSEYIDTTNHKHICSCGEDLTESRHSNPSIFSIIKNGKHLCKCGLENDKPNNGHDYSHVYAQVTSVSNIGEQVGGTYATSVKVVGTQITTASAGQGLVCIASSEVTNASGTTVTDSNGEIKTVACMAVSPSHKTHRWLDDGNHGHFCACGATSKDHDYNDSGVCVICGDLENHTHILNELCNCTVEGCGATGLHKLVKMGDEGHICEVCGTKVPAHVYDDIDTVKHEHKCSICGKVDESGHVYGTEGEAQCICQKCGYENHTSTTLRNGVHTCTICKKTVEHVYSESTDKCILTVSAGTCPAIKPGHVHAFRSNVDNATKDEKCRCGETLTHEYVLVYDGASKHKCVHKTDAESPADCALTATSHTYDETSHFCACGAVDPAQFTEAKAIDPSYYASTHTASYIVKLAKAKADVLAFDTTGKTTEEEIKAIKLANTAEAQAEYAAAVKELNDIYADAKNNQAGGYLSVALTDDSTGWGEVLKADGTYGANSTLGGLVGTEVTAAARAKAGYKFVGWFANSNPAADAKPFSTDATYTYKLQNGTNTVYAKFDANESKTITVPAGVQYRGSVTNLSWSDLTEAKEFPKFNLGETVYIKAGTTYNDKFLSFTDKFGYSHVYNINYNGTETALVGSDDNDCYKFTVTGDDALTLNVAPTLSPNTYYITFTNANGTKELQGGGTTKTNDGKAYVDNVATAPLALGRTFLGWKYKQSTQEALDAAPFVRLNDIKASGTLVPYYEAQTGLKLTVKGGRFGLAAEAEQNKTGFTFDDMVTLTADKQNAAGKYFSGWYVGTTMVSNRLTFKYAVKASVTIEAKYEGDEELVPESVYTLAYTQNNVNGTRQVVLTGNWAMASEATKIVDIGYVFSFNTVAANDLVLESADGTAIRKKSTGLTGKTGTHAYAMNLTSATTKNATVSAKFYVTYVDANGAQKTVYTNMVTVNP